MKDYYVICLLLLTLVIQETYSRNILSEVNTVDKKIAASMLNRDIQVSHESRRLSKRDLLRRLTYSRGEVSIQRYAETNYCCRPPTKQCCPL